MKGLWVQKAPGYSKRQFSFLSGKKMTALLTGIKLQIFKRKKGNFWVTHWTRCGKFGASRASPPRDHTPNVLTVHRGGGHHFRKGRCLSHSQNHRRGCTSTHSWMDDRTANPLTFHKQEYFLKISQTGLFLSISTTTIQISAVLTPCPSSCSHFQTGFPALELTPPECVLLTPQKVTWNSNIFPPPLKVFQQLPVAWEQKPSHLACQKIFYELPSAHPTQP